MRTRLLLTSILTTLTLLVGFTAPAVDLPIAEGPFQPTMESLTNYSCPEWFRDAKFGIWSHWGPQAVPMAGDWYAKHMYTQDNKRGQYQHHLTNYGHPSTNGWKDIIPLWKAEKWEPDRLMALYKQAGAKYFVSMGSHHDNFSLWNDKFHPWNAVNMGPHRDVVGGWQKAARKQGLKFGVSEHLGASFTWWQPSHGKDTNGPFAGVPYDGADPEWQDLYHWPAAPGDTAWYSTDPGWHQQWFARIKQLVDDYKPDLLYSDGALPFDETGRSLLAHYYNANMAAHRGKLDAVYCLKDWRTQPGHGDYVEGIGVQDVERGGLSGIKPAPWQTDTSIGDWFYNKNWKAKDTGTMYRSPKWVVHALVDVVSKNGNMLLNVVQRPDGSLDPEVEQLLTQIAAWMKVNSKAIFETRPWLTYGEGATKVDGGHFKEDFAFSAQDIRFTQSKDGKTVYAVMLGWPSESTVTLKSLADGKGPARISSVALLGSAGKLKWVRNADGLTVTLPKQKPCEHAFAFKIITR